MSDLVRLRVVCDWVKDDIDCFLEVLRKVDIADELELTGFVSTEKQLLKDSAIVAQRGADLLAFVFMRCKHLRFVKLDVFLLPEKVDMLRECTSDPIALHLKFAGP